MERYTKEQRVIIVKIHYKNLSKKIIFTDEAHFHLNGLVNKQNCRIWGPENLHVIQEKQMHPNEPLFGADFGQAVWLARIFMKMRLAML